MHTHSKKQAHFHLPGLFEFYDFYKEFLPLYYTHRDYFYDWCDISSIYGAPADCLWGGGRVGFGDDDVNSVLALLEQYKISGRLTFSNLLLTREHLSDKKCNALCTAFSASTIKHGVIIASDLLLSYLQANYPSLYLVSSTTKVLTQEKELLLELDRPEFAYIVPDFRLNKAFTFLSSLSDLQKDKIEFLCNECCFVSCTNRRACYESVSKKSLGVDDLHTCSFAHAKEGYRFSKAMENPAFIGTSDIVKTYLPMGFTNFKIEGRSLGSALLLEFILYYMTKPDYHLKVREALYLDSMLDLF